MIVNLVQKKKVLFWLTSNFSERELCLAKYLNMESETNDMPWKTTTKKQRNKQNRWTSTEESKVERGVGVEKCAIISLRNCSQSYRWIEWSWDLIPTRPISSHF